MDQIKPHCTYISLYWDVYWGFGRILSGWRDLWGRCVSSKTLVLEVGGGTTAVTQLKIATMTSIWPDSTLWVIYDQPSSLLLHLAYGNDPGLKEGCEVGWRRTWMPQRPVWPVFVVSHWTGSSFFDLLHAFPLLSYANVGQTRGRNTLELSGGGQRVSLSFPASFPCYIFSFLASFLSSNLTDFGMKGSECLVDGKGGDGVLSVTRTTCEDQVHCSDPWLCVHGVLFWVALVVCCRSVIVPPCCWCYSSGRSEASRVVIQRLSALPTRPTTSNAPSLAGETDTNAVTTALP